MTPTDIIKRSIDRVDEAEAAKTLGTAQGGLQATELTAKESIEKVSAIISSTRDLVGEKEAAEILGVAQGTLQVWRSTGRYSIPFLKVGRLVKYRRRVLESWLESRTRTSGATA